MRYKIAIQAVTKDGVVLDTWIQRAESADMWGAFAVAGALVRTGVELSDKRELVVTVAEEEV